MTQHVDPRPLVIGEAPAPTTPRGAPALSGRPARILCGLAHVPPSEAPHAAASELLQLANLLPDHRGRGWPTVDARQAAADLDVADRVVVLLGRRVATAFGLHHLPWCVWQHDEDAVPAAAFVVIPHPSGLNRVLNDPTERQRAGLALREAIRRGDPTLEHTGTTWTRRPFPPLTPAQTALLTDLHHASGRPRPADRALEVHGPRLAAARRLAALQLARVDDHHAEITPLGDAHARRGPRVVAPTLLLAKGGSQPTYPPGHPDWRTDDGHPDPPGDPLAAQGYTASAGRALTDEPEAVDPALNEQRDVRNELRRMETLARHERERLARDMGRRLNIAIRDHDEPAMARVQAEIARLRNAA